MDIEEMLRESESAIIADAARAIGRLEHYRCESAEETKRRVGVVYRHLVDAVCKRDVKELRAYTADVARERVAAGFHIAEVVAAFSAIEEAVWHHALVRLPAYDQAWGIGLACTVLAHGKAELGRAVDAEAPFAPPAIDLTSLIRGTGPVPASVPEEKVFPI